MDRSLPRSPGASPSAALLALEARWLLSNRAACGVLLLTLVAAAGLRLARSRPVVADRGACFVVYWQKDAWVEHLQAATEEFDTAAGTSPQIVPVEQLVDDEGTIRYPPGVHSIQLRPAEPGGGAPARRLVWFWYAGDDPGALLPYVRWFWQATAEHFGPARFEQRASALQPELSVFGRQTRVRAAAVLRSAELEIGLVAAAMFFCACYLPTLSLAEARLSRTLDSLVVTPAGWAGAVRARQAVYGALGIGLAATTAAILRPAVLGSVWLWWSLLGATVLGLGIAQTAGSLCRSVTSAGAALVLYVTAAGLLAAGSANAVGNGTIGWLAPWMSAEGSLFGLLRFAWSDDDMVPVSMLLAVVAWAVGWQCLGRWAYRRLRAG